VTTVIKESCDDDDDVASRSTTLLTGRGRASQHAH